MEIAALNFKTCVDFLEDTNSILSNHADEVIQGNVAVNCTWSTVIKRAPVVAYKKTSHNPIGYFCQYNKYVYKTVFTFTAT